MDSYDRFGPKVVCNSTCCTIRATPPCFGAPAGCGCNGSAFAPYAGLEGGLGYPPLVRPLPPPPMLPEVPLFLEDAPRFIPAREARFCSTGFDCLPVPVAPGWCEVGYVYSVRRRFEEEPQEDRGCCGGRNNVPNYRFDRRRGQMPPTRRGSEAFDTPQQRSRSMERDDFNARSSARGKRRSFDDNNAPSPARSNSNWHREEKSCGCDGECDCDKTVINNYYYYSEKKERRREDCCLTRRYRLFARTPYGFGCRSMCNSSQFQYAVQEENHRDALLITLDPDPLFNAGEGRNGCGGGTCSQRWQELYTGCLIRIPGECIPFRVHLFTDDFNPPPRCGGYNDGYY